jgi:hypothetical protein
MNPDNSEYDVLFAELTAVLAEKTEAAVEARTTLRDAVCAYVSVEQERGIPLETIIQAVKQLLRAAENDGARTSDALAVQLIDWCVEFHRSSKSPEPAIIS